MNATRVPVFTSVCAVVNEAIYSSVQPSLRPYADASLYYSITNSIRNTVETSIGIPLRTTIRNEVGA